MYILSKNWSKILQYLNKNKKFHSSKERLKYWYYFSSVIEKKFVTKNQKIKISLFRARKTAKSAFLSGQW